MAISYTSPDIQISGAETFDNLATYLNGSGSAYGTASEAQIIVDGAGIKFASGATLTKGTSRRNAIIFGNTATAYRIESASYTQANIGEIDFGADGVFVLQGKGWYTSSIATINCRLKCANFTFVCSLTSANTTKADFFYRATNDVAILDIATKMTIILNNSVRCTVGLLFDTSLASFGALEFLEGDGYDNTIDLLSPLLNAPDGDEFPPVTFPVINGYYLATYHRTLATADFIANSPTFLLNKNIVFQTFAGGTHSIDNIVLPDGFTGTISGLVSTLADSAPTQRCRYSFTAPEFVTAGGWILRVWDDTETQLNDVALASEHKIIWRSLVNPKDGVTRVLTERTNAKVRLRQAGYSEVNLSYTNYNSRVDYLAPPLADPLWSNTGVITSIATAQELYDEYCKELDDDLSIDKDLTREGSQINLGGYSLVLDTTATPLIAIVDGVSVTAKSASTFTDGATGTGTVTIQGATAIDGGTFDNTGGVVYSSSETTLTNVNADLIDFTVAGTYTNDGGTWAEVTNSSGGAVVINNVNGGSVTLNSGPSITITNNVTITASLVNGTRVQLYNITKDAELDNSLVASGNTYTYTADTLSAGVDVGDILRLRHIYVSGTSCNAPESLTGTLTATGLTFSTSQTACPIYEGNAIDGSTVTEFSADYPNVQVDINDPDNSTTVQRLYAWFVYNTSTEDGIRDFYGGMVADDEINYKIVTSILDLKLDNVAATPVVIIGARLYRDDSTTVIASGSIQLDPDKAYLASGGDINVTQVNGVAVTISDFKAKATVAL